MNTRTFVIPMRITAATLILTCTLTLHPATTTQSTPRLQFAQLATAVLTLPASAATVAYPDAKGFVLLDAALCATNEILAAYRQESYYNAGWACIDIIQTIRALATLTAKQIPQHQGTDDIEWDGEAATDIDTTNDESNAPAPTTPNTQDWASFKRTADYALITAEATARTWAASLSNEHTTQAHDNLWWHKSEELHGLTSLIRLTRQSLCTENNHQMLILALLTANAVALVVQHTRFYTNAAQRYHDELKRAGHGTTTTAAASTTKPAQTTTPASTNQKPAQPVIALNTIPTPNVRNGISLGDNIVVTRPTAADKEICGICREELNQPAPANPMATLINGVNITIIDGENATIRTLDCNHKFHTYCIHNWICTQSNSSDQKEHGRDQTLCPLCRAPIEGTHNVARDIPLNLYDNQRDGIDDNVV